MNNTQNQLKQSATFDPTHQGPPPPQPHHQQQQLDVNGLPVGVQQQQPSPVNARPQSSSTKRERLDEESDDDDGRKPNKERRKIDIKFITDKSRRHITFSKRKAGIMKKAYELSVLTGTQVLLLVVSETGLVYTFTTPKLQPLVTKPEGKNLIQACLNAPEEMPAQSSVPHQPHPQQTPPMQQQQQQQQHHPDDQGVAPPQGLVQQQQQQGGPEDHMGRGVPLHRGPMGVAPQMAGNYLSPEQAAAYQYLQSIPNAQNQRYMAPQHHHP